MTGPQRAYYDFINIGLESYNGDVSRAINWCTRHYQRLPKTQWQDIKMMSTHDRNEVVAKIVYEKLQRNNYEEIQRLQR